MQPNSTAFVATAAALALAAVVAVPLLWDARRARRSVRACSVVLATVLTATTMGAVVNKLGDFFPTWSSLFGGDGSGLSTAGGLVDADLSGVSGRLDGELHRLAAKTKDGHGLLVAVRFDGARSHISRNGAVYVPAAYLDPRYAGYSFPVLEFLGGSPSNPAAVLHAMNLRTALDRAIGSGLIPPTIVVIPRTNDSVYRDQECVDAVGGAKDDTYLTADLRDDVDRDLRVRPDRDGWALMGVSTGGYCAVNLALRHPQWYDAAASLSGYFTAITDPTTGDLYRGNLSIRQANDPMWLVRHRPVPPLAFFLAAGNGEPQGLADLAAFAKQLHSPASVTTFKSASGGHWWRTWQDGMQASWGWLGEHLGGVLRVGPAPIGLVTDPEVGPPSLPGESAATGPPVQAAHAKPRRHPARHHRPGVRA